MSHFVAAHTAFRDCRTAACEADQDPFSWNLDETVPIIFLSSPPSFLWAATQSPIQDESLLKRGNRDLVAGLLGALSSCLNVVSTLRSLWWAVADLSGTDPIKSGILSPFPFSAPLQKKNQLRRRLNNHTQFLGPRRGIWGRSYLISDYGSGESVFFPVRGHEGTRSDGR